MSTNQRDDALAGRCVRLAGKLASMPRREAESLIEAHGGRIAERAGGPVDLIVVSDDAGDLHRLAADRSIFDDQTRQALGRGDAELLRESELWARLGLVDSGHGVERLYTPAMLAELLHVPISAIRQWHRRGALRAKCEVRRLPYFDFEEVRAARKLAQLLEAGCSLSVIDRKLGELSRLRPDLPRPLSDPAVVVEGRSLRVRCGDAVAEPSGQLLIDFDAGQSPGGDERDSAARASIPIAAAGRRPETESYSIDDLLALAAEFEQSGRCEQAIEVYRAILVSGEFAADEHFALAELLYRQGDLSAARERYYVAIEIDEDFVEARSNLGCVLAEQGELELAEAALRGALRYHPDYSDAHFHLARLLDRAGRGDEAERHWRQFMQLAPASPWADEARERLEACGSGFAAAQGVE